MYVYASVFIKRSNVHALPQEAMAVSGNQTYCYLLKDSKAVKTPVEAGVSDGTWTEVDKMKIGDSWVKVNGDEPVIMGDLSELVNGQTVEVGKTATEQTSSTGRPGS